MTNHWIDYRNADVIMAIGANTAENHPISMRWIDAARERGGRLIAVDPRFTRTAAVADLYAPLRPGTDIAFLGGLINYALENNLYDEAYLKLFTNSTYLVNPDYSFADGMFSGATGTGPDKVKYSKSTWSYQLDKDGNALKDPAMKSPNCVFQLLRKHFSRYDIGTVCAITGTPEDVYKKVADTYCGTGRPGKAGTILYAMGITQHTYGSQNVRAIAMLQLLLGNVGIAGGGVNAQRGESNVQGSTDMGMLFDVTPGYMNAPKASAHPTLQAYLEVETPKSSYWTNKPKFIVSLLKAFWGDAAVKENDFAYDFWPKLDDSNHSHIAMFEDMDAGGMKGLFAWGQNFAVGGPDAKRERRALSKLDWLVVADIFETEVASFWYKQPGINSAAVNTEVFLLPAAISYEKEGSIANSGRWIQWRDKALDPLGDAKSDLWMVDKLFKAVRAAYQSGGKFPDPIVKMNWNYGGEGSSEPDIAKVALEINGYETAAKKPLLNFTALAADGSTACGCWIYSGYYNNPAAPPTKKRIPEKQGIGLNPDWAYAWPLNRRILYNRCSSDATGKPRDSRAPVVYWDGVKWVTSDVADFVLRNADGTFVTPETSATRAFIMLPELQGLLFADRMVEGPFPEHYEPVESPTKNRMSKTQVNPAITILHPEEIAAVGSVEFPYVATTYRVAEHWQSGIMTRNSPWLNEMMPGMFVEISAGLASRLGVANGDKVSVGTKRGEILAQVCVTDRLRPLVVDGRQVEIVGLPWHWGYAGMSTGAVANDLTHHVGDANTMIPEYKAFLCRVRKVDQHA
jgi:formate dehydrogenase major subunit